MDIHQLSILYTTWIVVVIVIGMIYAMKTIQKSHLYPDQNGLDIGLKNFKSNAHWWSDKTRENMEKHASIAERDYALFCTTGKKSLIMHPQSVVHYRDKNGSSVSAPVGTDSSYL